MRPSAARKRRIFCLISPSHRSLRQLDAETVVSRAVAEPLFATKQRRTCLDALAVATGDSLRGRRSAQHGHARRRPSKDPVSFSRPTERFAFDCFFGRQPFVLRLRDQPEQLGAPLQRSASRDPRWPRPVEFGQTAIERVALL